LSIWRQISQGSATKRKVRLDFAAIEEEFFADESDITLADDEV
jgi:hypothetical protein